MSDHRYEKIESQLVGLSAKFIAAEAGPGSLITVIKAEAADRSKAATIFVTVFPTDQEKSALDFLKRKRSEFRDYLKEHSRLPVIPFIDFEIDYGEKNRQRIEVISKTS